MATSDVTVNGLSAPENRRHYPGLDGLRGVAVLLVLVQHYVFLSMPYIWGWVGVRIFFVLSGFLITGILFDTRNAPRRWSVFYARRALRIFPLYYGVLAGGMLLYPIFRWVVHPSWVLWPLYLQNYGRFFWPDAIQSGVVDHLRSTRFLHPPFFLYYGHLWSLALEEQFYLVWPLVVFAVRRRETLMRICVGVVVLLPFVRLLCALTLPVYLLNAGVEDRFTPLQCDSLLLGALLALWIRGPAPDMTRLAKRALWVLLGIAVLSEILCPILYGHAVYPGEGDPIFASLGYAWVNFGSAALVLLAIDPATKFSRGLQNRRLRWLGTISYGFYVFHDIPHMFYQGLAKALPLPNPRGLLTAVLALGGTLLLASASFYGFERPFLKLKRRFTVQGT
ncbi:MAG: acyltransferase family protein [Janthinobacterium lividum]